MSYKLQYVNTVEVNHKLYFSPEKVVNSLGIELKPVSIYPIGHKLSKTSTKIFSKYPSMHRSLNYEPSRKNSFWEGELELDIYGIKNLKGTGSESIPNFKLAFNTHGEMKILGIEGLLTKKEADKIIEFQKLRKELNLPTDRAVQISEIHEVFVGNKLISIEQWKKWIMIDFKNTISDYFGKQNAISPSKSKKIKQSYLLNFKYLPEAKKRIKNIRFFCVERELQVAERLKDFAQCSNDIEFKKILGRVFDWLNIVLQDRNKGIIPGTLSTNKFDINIEQDIKRYFTEWLPSQIGIYLGRLHKKGYFAKATHSQNWSGAGTLYDIAGGIEKISSKKNKAGMQRGHDAFMTGFAFIELFNPPKANYLKGKNYLYKAIYSFLASYYGEIGRKITLEDLRAFYWESIRFYMSELPGKKYVHEDFMKSEKYLKHVAGQFGFKVSVL